MQHETVERACCVHGYHIYKEVWAAAVGEVLVCEREPKNAADRYAVSSKEEQLDYRTHTQKSVTRLLSFPTEGRDHSVYSDWKMKVLQRFTSGRP